MRNENKEGIRGTWMSGLSGSNDVADVEWSLYPLNMSRNSGALVKESYIRHVILLHFLDGNFDVKFEDGWISERGLNEIISRTAFEAFAAYGLRVGQQYQSIVDDVFTYLMGKKGISQRGDPYAGFWYRLNVARKNELVRNEITGNPASNALANLPGLALANALKRIAREDALEDVSFGAPQEAVEASNAVASEIIPGSDRFISIAHNQVSELDRETTTLIDAVENLNAIDGNTDHRATVIGALKAGRELVRAGVFKLYALEVTLIEAAKFLAKRYEREAIGALAAALLSFIASHLGIPI